MKAHNKEISTAPGGADTASETADASTPAESAPATAAESAASAAPARRGLSRRGLLFGAGALAVGVMAGVGTRPLVAQVNVLRPPGSLPEADFMGRCIRCERCISVCPTDILRPMGIEEGVLQVRTPTLTYEDNCCTFCDLCRQVCPTAAIESADPYQPAQGRIGVAVIIEDRCLAFLQSQSCGICVDACPYDALSFDASRRPVVDESLCNGCGECVRICPANVATSFSGGTSRGVEVVTETTFTSWEVAS